MARRGGVEQAQRRCIGRLPMLAVLDRAASFFRPFTSRSAAMRPGSRSARRSDGTKRFIRYLFCTSD